MARPCCKAQRGLVLSSCSFLSEETEDQKGAGTRPISHSQQEAGMKLEPRSLCPAYQAKL